jgi:hypothetical protein
MMRMMIAKLFNFTYTSSVTDQDGAKIMMEATARLHSIIYKQKKRLSLSGQDRRKFIHQAVFTSLPTGNSARTAYLYCIKDGTNIDPCCALEVFL